MKNTIIILFVLSIFLNVSGQETKKINYQINFGASVSIPYKNQIEASWNMDKNAITYFNSDIGYFADLMISFNFNKRMLLNTGVSYINSRVQEHGYAGIIEKDGTIQTNYIGIPVTFDYQLLRNKPFRAGLGLYLNFLWHAGEKGTVYYDTTGFYMYPPDPLLESFNPVQEYSRNISDNYKFIDYGLVAKLEYEFKLTKKLALLVFSKFNFGTAKIRELPNWYDEWRNYNLLFGIGLKI